MPELPEVETVARELRAHLVGRAIVGVDVFWPRSVHPSLAAFARRIKGRKIASVDRRGKWIIIQLVEDGALLIHLRMTGRLILETEPGADIAHRRVLFRLDNGQTLSFVDPRKFGRLLAVREPDRILRELGPEPLAEEFTAARLQEMLIRRRARIKPLLMNQRFLAGLGNIYADEALWRASIHPLRHANSLSPAEAQHLHKAIQSTLQGGLEDGGTTLSDGTFQQPDGQIGKFGARLAVYGRNGLPCPRCGAAIERVKVDQRSTYFCPRCQKPPSP